MCIHVCQCMQQKARDFQHRLELKLLPLCQSSGTGYSLSGYGGDTNAPLGAGVLILSDKLHCTSASLRDGCIVLQMKQGQTSKHDGFSVTLSNCIKPPQHMKEGDMHKQFLRLFLHHKTLGCFVTIHLQHRACRCIFWTPNKFDV